MHIGARAIGVGVDDDSTADGRVSLVREDGDVLRADGVVGDNWRVAGRGEGGEEPEGNARGAHCAVFVAGDVVYVGLSCEKLRMKFRGRGQGMQMMSKVCSDNSERDLLELAAGEGVGYLGE